MRLQRTQNRIVNGKTYEKWVLVLPPDEVEKLGWSEGVEIRPIVRGRELRLRPIAERPH